MPPAHCRGDISSETNRARDRVYQLYVISRLTFWYHNCMIMKRYIVAAVAALVAIMSAGAITIASPGGDLEVQIDTLKGGIPAYSVWLDGRLMVRKSPLGFNTNIGPFTRVDSIRYAGARPVDEHYRLDRIKRSDVSYRANVGRVDFVSPGARRWSVVFSVADHDVAFRYVIPVQGETRSIYIESEETGFRFPKRTTTFLTPQSDPMIGWKRTKPSYEEEYVIDAPMDSLSQYGHGYTFPCLFKVGLDGWVLVSETGVDSRYCASHLSDHKGDGLYTIAYPMPGENNGNGNTGAAMALPAVTPWRTVTVGTDLAPIVETTVMWDVVKPLYTTENAYKYGRGTWSWILWQDKSINIDDQKRYIDLAHHMGYEYVLIDNWWDNNIGRERLPELVEYARDRGVEVFMWYSSSGYWNDIEQGPVNCMDNPIVRKREMRWLRDLGVKGIKVDFFGGDKQETMRLYEAILSDADDNGLMVIFHGCTLPRGWERMYPNYVGSEAVLASENIYFQQHFCDVEPVNATLHPFIRNTVGCMEFGGCFMNRYMSRGNNKGNRRITTDAFELATTILFQNPIQNFALAPNNLKDAPAVCMDFLKTVPTTWDETRFIDGYPGMYAVLARRHGSTWYIAGVNATDSPMDVYLKYSRQGERILLLHDEVDGTPVRTTVTVGRATPWVTMQPNGGFVAVIER